MGPPAEDKSWTEGPAGRSALVLLLQDVFGSPDRRGAVLPLQGAFRRRPAEAVLFEEASRLVVWFGRKNKLQPVDLAVLDERSSVAAGHFSSAWISRALRQSRAGA